VTKAEREGRLARDPETDALELSGLLPTGLCRCGGAGATHHLLEIAGQSVGQMRRRQILEMPRTATEARQGLRGEGLGEGWMPV